jgi:hypothetical protein
MESNRSKLWSITLGALIGLILGAAIPYLLIEAEPRWKQQFYAAISPLADDAIEIVGYGSQSESLYVKGQSQVIYACQSGPFDDPVDGTTCRKASPEAIAKRESCNGIVTQFKEPADKVISRLTVFDCRFNEYTPVQINYVILDDGTLWRLVYSSFNLMEPFRNCLVVVGAIMGISIGIGIGAAIPRMAHRDPHKHQ